jgi:nucleoid DNA-binding protein
MSKSNDFSKRFHGKVKAKARFTMTVKEVAFIIDSFIDSIDEELKEGNTVKFKDAFTMKQVKSTISRRNPKAKKTLPPSERTSVKCKMSKKFGGYNIATE